MYIIRYYKNRKFYNTETSQYVNLSQLETLFKALPDVHVIDSEGDDVTGRVMLSVIANKKENAEDVLILSRILRRGDGLLSNVCVYDDRESFDT
jgi:polyhydroxyalkanoate synthesis regulator protein